MAVCTHSVQTFVTQSDVPIPWLCTKFSVQLIGWCSTARRYSLVHKLSPMLDCSMELVKYVSIFRVVFFVHNHVMHSCSSSNERRAK